MSAWKSDEKLLIFASSLITSYNCRGSTLLLTQGAQVISIVIKTYCGQVLTRIVIISSHIPLHTLSKL